jgi:hypothetical protein
MNRRWTAVALLATLGTGLVQLAHAADPAANKSTGRWAGSVQIEASRGGDDLYNDEVQSSTASIGDGVAIGAGLLYRPFERSAFELQGWVGYKFDWFQGVFGDDVGFSRNVIQLLGNYRNNDKWYVGGGLVFHLHPEFEDQLYGFNEQLEFDDATGVTIEGGWNWVGLQCTYIEYKSPIYGKFDGSNCGVRITFRFPRWRPVN